MTENYSPLDLIQTRRYLEEVNHYLLNDKGEVRDAPGKFTLVWYNSALNLERFLAVKAAGEDQILVNGRRYPATEKGLKEGLVTCLSKPA